MVIQVVLGVWLLLGVIARGLWGEYRVVQCMVNYPSSLSFVVTILLMRIVMSTGCKVGEACRTAGVVRAQQTVQFE